MANPSGNVSSVPVKIVIGLTICILLGLGLCGAGTAMHVDRLQDLFFNIGAVFFWGGLALLILFGIGWAVVAVARQLLGKER